MNADQIKELREKTGAGISDIKKALDESGGDGTRALQIIERKLGGAAAQKALRTTRAGLVDAYIHSNGRVGTLVEVFCETDFVARNPQFKELVHDVAMHVAAMNPQYLSIDAIPPEVWQREKSQLEEEVKTLGKPAHIIAEIIDGKLKSFFGARSLLQQAFIKDQDKTVEDLINEAIGKFGENIKIGRFSRFEV